MQKLTISLCISLSWKNSLYLCVYLSLSGKYLLYLCVSLSWKTYLSLCISVSLRQNLTVSLSSLSLSLSLPLSFSSSSSLASWDLLFSVFTWSQNFVVVVTPHSWSSWFKDNVQTREKKEQFSKAASKQQHRRRRRGSQVKKVSLLIMWCPHNYFHPCVIK